MFRPNNLSLAITEHNATQLPCLNVRKRNFPGSLEKSLQNDILKWIDAIWFSGRAGPRIAMMLLVRSAENKLAPTCPSRQHHSSLLFSLIVCFCSLWS